MSDATEQRIAVLESEIRALKLLLGSQSRTFAAPPRRDEPTVKITHPVRQVTLPGDAERHRLCEIVLTRYPSLRPRAGEDEEFAAGFLVTFRFVESCGRRAEPDRQRALGFWIDEARSFVSQNRIGGFPISGPALVVAIIAAGDVPYSDPNAAGFVCGLQFGGGGRPSTEKWRDVLTTGRLLDPTPSPYPQAAASPSRVQRSV
jgi:hypothetical protein